MPLEKSIRYRRAAASASYRVRMTGTGYEDILITKSVWGGRGYIARWDRVKPNLIVSGVDTLREAKRLAECAIHDRMDEDEQEIVNRVDGETKGATS